MTLKEILAELKSLGSEKVRTLNIRNGAGDNQYGVQLGAIRTLAKKLKTNPSLAMELWETGNLDAQLLAILLLKPKDMSVEEIDKLVKSVNYVQVADWLNLYVVKDHRGTDALREGWMNSDNVMAARAGWSLTAGRIARKPEGLDIKALLDRIEREMPGAASEVQWTMNTALAQIGINFPEYRQRAIGIGDALGVYRDYPVSKGCTSPFAPIWINEMVSRRENS